MALDFDRCYAAVAARDTRFDGRFYTAVTSTGIFCRPSCPARTPARGNVRFFPSAAAATAAGFRACRRCRPEIAPGAPGWDLRADLAARAVALIEEGVADREGVAGLARRLHISQRQLHRVLVTELGTGAQGLARARRARLARQLLDGTDLALSRVAFAAGYGSVRQFDAEMHRVFGAPPSALRRGVPGRAAGIALHLPARQPFDGAGVLAFLAGHGLPGVDRVGDGTYQRRLRVPSGEVVAVTATPDARGVRVTLPAGAGTHVGWVAARIRRLFDLDADPAAVAQALTADDLLAPLVAARPGVRVPGAADGFETAVHAVIAQQISVAAARTLLGRLLGPDGLLPPPAVLAEAPDHALGLPAGRSRTLRALAAAVACGDLDLSAGADPDTTAAALLALPGVGPWTAGYVTMRALGHPDAWPSGDLGLRRGLAALTRTGLPSPAHLDRHAACWRPWRAYAAVHLWRMTP